MHYVLYRGNVYRWDAKSVLFFVRRVVEDVSIDCAVVLPELVRKLVQCDGHRAVVLRHVRVLLVDVLVVLLEGGLAERLRLRGLAWSVVRGRVESPGLFQPEKGGDLFGEPPTSVLLLLLLLLLLFLLWDYCCHF